MYASIKPDLGLWLKANSYIIVPRYNNSLTFKRIFLSRHLVIAIESNIFVFCSLCVF